MLSRLNMFVIRVVLIICVLMSAFFYSSIVEAASSYSSSFNLSGSTATTGIRFHTLLRDLDSIVLDSSAADLYYSVTIRTSVTLNSTQALNYRIPYVSVGDHLFWIGSNLNDSAVYSDSVEKTFIMSGSELTSSLPVQIKGYLFADELAFEMSGNVEISVLSVQSVSTDSKEQYEAGFDAGYTQGQEFGYSDGYSDGYLEGEDKGYSAGFEAGKDSVDIDSIYMDGYNTGVEVAYAEGYDEGYLKGYAEALSLDSFNSTSLKSGSVKNYSVSKQLVVSQLDEYDLNTSLPTFLNCFESGFSGYSEGSWFADGDISTFYNSLHQYQLYDAFGYTRLGLEPVFKTDANVYAYSIKFNHNLGEPLVKKYIHDFRFLFGTESDILSDDSFSTGTSLVENVSSSVFWFVNDYSVQQLYFCPLLRFGFGHETKDSFYSGELNIWYAANLEVTPYTKAEYNASVSAIEKQTLEMKQQFNDIKNGFDSSAADSMNDGFSASLNDYEISQDSLFNAAQSGLSGFTFVDFSSYPALVTSMSFVTSLMTSFFGAMGGESGPMGIVLSVLFSVMLVSMAIGLYRFYSGKKDGDG